MQKEFKFTHKPNELMEINYKYPLYGAIINSIKTFDKDSAESIHDDKKISMFSISSIIPTSHKGNELNSDKSKIKFKTEEIYFRVASRDTRFFTLLEYAFTENPELDINGKKITFKCSDDSRIKTPSFKEEMIWIPYYFGSIVSRGEGHNEYLSPLNCNECKDSLRNTLIKRYFFYDLDPFERNMLEKNGFKIDYSEQDLIDSIDFEFIGNVINKSQQNKKKDGTFMKVDSWACKVKVKAPKIIQKIIYDTGLGSLTAQGYGLVNVVEEGN